jgi:hypothetical protein
MEYVETTGVTECNYVMRIDECTNIEESCWAYVIFEDEEYEGFCDEIETVLPGYEGSYSDDCSEEGYDADCFDMFVDYIDFL